MKPTVGVAFICNKWSEEFKRALLSAAPHFDEIVVVDTSLEADLWAKKDVDIPHLRIYALQDRSILAEDGMLLNFAAARNESFGYLQGLVDWGCWQDSDDTLEGGEGFRALAENAPPEAGGYWLPYRYAHDEYGNVLTVHSRERMVRMSVGWTWTGRLHETLAPNRPTQWIHADSPVFIHADGHQNRSPRNLRLLHLMLEEEPDNIRVWYYLGNQHFANRDWPKAVEWYRKFYRDERGFHLERWQAMTYAARALREMGRFRQAVAVDNAAMLMHPEYADPYLGLATSHLALGEPDKARTFAEMALLKVPPPDLLFINHLDYTFAPYNVLNIACAATGDLDAAIEACDAALSVRPNEEGIQRNRALYVAARERKQQVDAYALLAPGLSDSERVRVARGMPDGFRREPDVRAWWVPAQMRLSKRGSQPEAAIFCGPTMQRWAAPTPETEGIGGSETAVVEVARRLAKEGWRVNVYGTPEELEGWYDGVGYLDWHRYRPDSPVELLVGWRNPALPAKEAMATRRWLWLHDLHGGERRPDEFLQWDSIFGVSRWHADYLGRQYPALAGRAGHLPNGISLERFALADDDEARRQRYKCVYTSSPDRGLTTLLTLWPRLRDVEPTAELHIFYGWDNIDRMIERGDSGMAAFKARTVALTDQPGVFWRGKVPQKELAAELLTSDLWLYPTSFLETFCCTGDTLIDMPRDYSRHPNGVPIRDLVGKKGFPVWCYNEETGQFQLSPVKGVGKTGLNKEVWRLTFDDGTYLRATPDHPVLTYKRGWVELKDLQPGESVVHLKKHTMVQVSVGRGAWPHEHRLVAEWAHGPIPKGYHVDHIDGNSLNNTPENLQYLSPSEHAKKTFTGQFVPPKVMNARLQGWRKWYEEDEEGRESLHQRLSAMGSKLWEKVNALPREERAAWLAKRATAKRASLKKKEEALSDEERAALRESYQARGRKGAAARYNHKVASVAFDCYEDVYNMEVDGPHNYVANGIVIHNCIGAVEAMAAGLYPVTSRCGALSEVIGDAYPTVPGIAGSPSYTQQWMGLALAFLVHVETRARYYQRGVTRAKEWTWDNAFYRAWMPKLKEAVKA